MRAVLDEEEKAGNGQEAQKASRIHQGAGGRDGGEACES